MFYFMIVMTLVCILNLLIMFFIVCKLLKEVIGEVGMSDVVE